MKMSHIENCTYEKPENGCAVLFMQGVNVGKGKERLVSNIRGEI